MERELLFERVNKLIDQAAELSLPHHMFVIQRAVFNSLKCYQPLSKIKYTNDYKVCRFYSYLSDKNMTIYNWVRVKGLGDLGSIADHEIITDLLYYNDNVVELFRPQIQNECFQIQALVKQLDLKDMRNRLLTSLPYSKILKKYNSSNTLKRADDTYQHHNIITIETTKVKLDAAYPTMCDIRYKDEYGNEHDSTVRPVMYGGDIILIEEAIDVLEEIYSKALAVALPIYKHNYDIMEKILTITAPYRIAKGLTGT